MKNITVIGSGTMGNGIAHTFAQHGFNVSLVDINSDALGRAMQTITANLYRQVKKGVIDELVKTSTLANIQLNTNLKTAAGNADLVVEAATENPNIKFNLFRQLSEFCRPDAILRPTLHPYPLHRSHRSQKIPEMLSACTL